MSGVVRSTDDSNVLGGHHDVRKLIWSHVHVQVYHKRVKGRGAEGTER